MHPPESLLIVDDEDVARYLLKGTLTDTRFTVLEASSGDEGIKLARARHPRAILLDLIMGGLDGFEVLDRLKADTTTRGIPVIVVTSKILNEQERNRLARNTTAIVSKQSLSRQEVVTAIRNAIARVSPDTDGGEPQER
jgi:CheY-like chemotaxis protein